jgi:hypothetical protein
MSTIHLFLGLPLILVPIGFHSNNLLGDFNAKLGKEQLYKDITGRHSIHEVTNNNGLRLVQYATINNFKVLSTWFPRKDIYKGTWKKLNFNAVNY